MSRIKILLKRILSFLFQTECSLCEKWDAGEVVCCLKLDRISRCHGFIQDVTHPQSAYWLDDNILKLIHEVKYGGRTQLLKLWKREAQEIFKNYFPRGLVIVPVPQSPHKWLDRGFSVSNEMAWWMQPEFKVEDILEKVKETKSQATLDIKERKMNLKNAFQIRRPINFESCILMDDIWTTGTTLAECAKILKKAGVTTVYAWTLFRTPLRLRLGRGLLTGLARSGS